MVAHPRPAPLPIESTILTETARDRVRPTRRLQRGRARILALTDALALVIAYVITWAVANRAAPPAVDAPRALLVVLAPVALLALLATFAAYRLYEREAARIGSGTFAEVGGVFHALLAANLVMLVTGQLIARLHGGRVFSPAEALIFLAAALFLVPLARGSVRTWLLPHVMLARTTLLVGNGETSDRLERKIRSHPEYGLELVGRCGASDDITGRADELGASWVILADAPHGDPMAGIAALLDRGLQISVVPQQSEVFTSNATLDDIEGMPVVNLPLSRLSPTAHAVKRAFDLVVGSLLVVVSSPLLVLCALAIKLDSRGPVFYRQPRRGRNGGVFRILKFRTMVVGADGMRADLAHLNEVDGPLFKVRRDPRITRVGSLLRRTSLDELPQLWNVLRGEMSLVGPRPFVLDEADQIEGWGRRRLDLTPGMTGLWQVLGRNDIPYEEMLKLDYLYVTGWSVWWDLRILCETVPAVLRRQGAY